MDDKDFILKMQCKEAADIVVDALITAGLVSNNNGDRASEIAEEEILVRKLMGKL